MLKIYIYVTIIGGIEQLVLVGVIDDASTEKNAFSWTQWLFYSICLLNKINTILLTKLHMLSIIMLLAIVIYECIRMYTLRYYDLIWFDLIWLKQCTGAYWNSNSYFSNIQ